MASGKQATAAEEIREVRGLEDMIQEETLQECRLTSQEETYILSHLKEWMLSIPPVDKIRTQEVKLQAGTREFGARENFLWP